MSSRNDADLILVMDELDVINFRKKGYEKPGSRAIPFNSEFRDDTAEQLGKNNLLIGGNVLVRSLYSDQPKYYLLDVASEQIHADYFKCYSYILGLLGATSVSVSECYTNDEENATSVGAGVDVQKQGGKINVDHKKNEHIKALMDLKCTFASTIDVQQAKNLMKKYSLEGDTELGTIIAAIESGVKFTSRDYTLSLSKTLGSIFKLAAEIQPYAGIDIKAKMKRNKTIRETYSLHIKIEFGND